MTDSSIHQQALQSLRFFNAAISTVRLYPKTFPQVEKSIERAYQEIKLFIESHGEPSFGFDNDQPMLCSQVLFPDTPERIKDFPVFQHLQMIGLDNVLFKKSVDRPGLERLIEVFSTSVEQIKKKGGGRVFIKSLGVADFFPDKLETPDYIQAELEKKSNREKTAVVEVPKQYLLFLFGRQEDQRVLTALKKLFQVPEKAMAVMTSAVAYILRDLQKKKGHVITPLFPQVILKVDDLVEPDLKRKVAIDTASSLVKGLPEPALCVLLSQEFPADFGNELYMALIHFLEKGTFERIVDLLEEQTKQVDGSSPADKERQQLLLASYNRLAETNRGKQYKASGSVASIIKGAERKRQQARIQAGLGALLKGDMKQLQSEEFLATLPAAVEWFLSEGREEIIGSIIGKISKSFSSSADSGQEWLVQGLLIITEKLIELESWKYIEKLVPPLLDWLQRSKEPDDLYRRCAECLQVLAVRGWGLDASEVADLIAQAFFKIRTSVAGRSHEVIDLVGKIQDEGFDHRLLSEQIADYLRAPEEVQAGMRLIHQGPAANRVLLQALLDSDSADDRLHILELLSKLGKQLPQLVLEHIDEPMHWQKKLALISMLGEVGGEEHIDAVAVYLTHEKQEMQSEAFDCICKISGANKKKHLLAILARTGSLMRVRVVEALVDLADDQVAEEMINLLADRANFLEATASKLLINICEALGNSLSVAAIDPLKEFVQEKDKRSASHVKPPAYRAGARAIRKIETHQQELKERTKKARQLQRDAIRKAAMIKATTTMPKRKS